MLLYEFEGKQLFKNCGINVPESQLIESTDPAHLEGEKMRLHLRGVTTLVLKAQVLSGKRADAGGIVKVTQGVIPDLIRDLFKKTINGEKVEKILIEEMVEYEEEYYLSFSYSTETRGPVLTFGKGGTGVEQQGVNSFPVDILEQFSEEVALRHLRGEKMRLHLGGGIAEKLADVVVKLWQVFTKYDCELAEINPLVVGKPSTVILNLKGEGSPTNVGTSVYALDAKVILDDADFRREIKFPQRNLFGRPPTEAEIEARKIDQGDHRGTAGSVY